MLVCVSDTLFRLMYRLVAQVPCGFCLLQSLHFQRVLCRNNSVYCIFCTSNSHIVSECLVYFRFKLPSEIIPMHINKFMSKLSNVVQADQGA